MFYDEEQEKESKQLRDQHKLEVYKREREILEQKKMQQSRKY